MGGGEVGVEVEAEVEEEAWLYTPIVCVIQAGGRGAGGGVV